MYSAHRQRDVMVMRDAFETTRHDDSEVYEHVEEVNDV